MFKYENTFLEFQGIAIYFLVFEYLVTHYLDEVHKTEQQIQASIPVKQIGKCLYNLKCEKNKSFFNRRKISF